MSEIPEDEGHDFKVIFHPDYGWFVMNSEGRNVAGPFNSPVEAGQWARDEIVKRVKRDDRD